MEATNIRKFLAQALKESRADTTKENDAENGICHIGGEDKDEIEAEDRWQEEQNKMNSLEHTILTAFPDLREIVFHSDGSVVAKTGGGAKHPKKLYTIRPQKGVLPHYGEMANQAVKKLIEDNRWAENN